MSARVMLRERRCQLRTKRGAETVLVVAKRVHMVLARSEAITLVTVPEARYRATVMVLKMKLVELAFRFLTEEVNDPSEDHRAKPDEFKSG